MFNKITFVIFSFCIFTVITSSQEKISEYKEPAILEGSNLSVYADPNLRLTNEVYSENKSEIRYYLFVSSQYTKWRFTPRFDYTLSASFNTTITNNEAFSADDGLYTSGGISYEAGASYYLLKDKFFAGLYSRGNSNFSRGSMPDLSARVNPYIGYGRIKDAFIVNETSNFEKVLLDEKYINRLFDKKTRLVLNSILDKRNGNVFRSLFKDDDEIVFFTELEKFLLDEQLISKPLNARTTMKLYQTLYNANFVLFPLYKGYLFQAELGYPVTNIADSIKFAKTLTFSAAYGLPLSLKTSILFSAQFVFPLNSNYNRIYFETDMHSPVFLRSELQSISHYRYINPGYIFLDWELYDYKSSAEFNFFHYLSNTAGVTGHIRFTNGKRKDRSEKMDYELEASTELVLNIINKLRLNTGIYYSFDDSNQYQLSFGSGVSYIIF